MEPVVTEAFRLFIQDGSSGWLILLAVLAVMAVMVVHACLIRADPAGIARSLMNIHRRRLENMLKQEYLSPETRTLIERELRQRSLWKLTRLFNHRLQDLAVLFAERFNVRASYLSQWRTWLSERDGKICFNRRWYRFSFWLFCLSTTVSTGLLTTVLVVVFLSLVAWKAMVITFILVAFVWFPWLAFTLVPIPAVTRKMEASLVKFNEEQEAASHAGKSG